MDFHSDMPFVLFDTGTYLYCSMEESAKYVRPHGELGEYLHDYRLTNKGEPAAGPTLARPMQIRVMRKSRRSMQPLSRARLPPSSRCA